MYRTHLSTGARVGSRGLLPRWIVALALVPFVALPAAAQTLSPAEIVDQAKAGAVNIEGQADALVGLAWMSETTDAAASALARRELINFGRWAFPALRKAIVTVPPRYSADVVLVLTETRRHMTSGLDPTYLPALEEAVWFGTPHAKQLAMEQLVQHRFQPAMLAMIDSAYDHPELVEPVLRALRVLNDDRANYYLDEVMRTGDPLHRKMAAEALASIRGRCLDRLREATRSEDPEIRKIAIAELLPVTGLDDLTGLHEYAVLYPEDDPQTLERVRLRAMQLESLLQLKQDADAGEEDY